MASSTVDLDDMRHSLAHVLAHAVKDLFEDVKFGVGPVIKDGFYYDFDMPKAISEDDLKIIEKQMRKIISKQFEFTSEKLSIDKAKEREKNNNQPYKLELVNDLEAKGTTAANAEKGAGVSEASYYTVGEFTDLCRGGHVKNIKDTGAFKLVRVSGAYWRGDENNPQMQRIYGVAFATKDELDTYLKQQEEAKLRDHRKLGQELDLFVHSELVGSGLPLFTGRGTWLRELLGAYSQQLRKERGFERIWTPHMTKSALYKVSGHWDKFGEELFLVKSQETSDELVLKPMNCPHHAQIYASRARSYRDLPVRFMENTTDYRDEKSGELNGIERVRALTQDDSHVFCSEDQIEEEVSSLIEAAQSMYEVLGMPLQSINLSFRDDGEGYLGEPALWEKSQSTLEKLAKKNKLNYKIDPGEAAFYGPKIDFIASDAIGRTTQVATVQLDFVQPERFGLAYVAEDGAKQTPVAIHCALLGSIERFLSVYIEHTNGHFPFWLAPEQVRILTINDSVSDYAHEVQNTLKETVLMKPLKYNEVRSSLDERNESLGKKIREARGERIPMLIIIGPRDMNNREVSIRIGDEETTTKLTELSEFIKSQ